MENNPIIRKVFFWSLVLMFLITAPVISLYALGYRFSFERGIFVYSGSFTIKPTPQESEIFLNGTIVPKGIVNFLNYSYHLDGLRPGSYQVEVKKENYQTWRKVSDVHSGVSTEFWNVFLARENYTRKIYADSQSENFFISPKEENVATVKNNPDITVNILDIEDEEITMTFELEGYYFPKQEKVNVEWSPKGDMLIVPAIERETEKHVYFSVNLENGVEEKENYFSISELAKEEEIKNVRWDPSEKYFIFYIANENLYKININNPEEKILMAEGVGGYDINQSNLLYIKKANGIIYESSVKDGQSQKQITTSALENTNYDNLVLIAYDEDRMGIITGNKELYVFNNSEKLHFRKLSDNVLGLHFSNDGKKMTYWTDNEISAYFVRKWETQPGREENQNILITRSFEKINNVQWMKDYEHIIYSAGRNIRLIELDHRDNKNIFDLVKLNLDDTKVSYNPSKNIMYFTDKENSNDTELPKINAINLSERDDEEVEFN